jgi:hypothetical protein
MSGGVQLLDKIKMQLRCSLTGNIQTVHIDVFDNSLGRKWLSALNDILRNNLVLEKNFCFLGFTESKRDPALITSEINRSIEAINAAKLGYVIDDYFSEDNTIQQGPIGHGLPGLKLVQEKMNMLHRYFEDLQGVSGNMSPYYNKADPVIRWHIRQLNLLCHEYESLILSRRKKVQAPEWQRPSQLMCWLNAPRFTLDEEDFDLFGIESIARPLGGVFVGVNKAVGKHHWEVFNDEGRDSRIDELTTTSLRGQTEAAGDFDIEWANDPGKYPWMQEQFVAFRQWLIANGFDPEDKSLTIGHPQVGQVDLYASFATEDYNEIWQILTDYSDVCAIETSEVQAEYNYSWSDKDFMERQIRALQGR